ncbi:EF-Tu C-terminal domain-related protein [Chryseobacterium salviniae]|uniref:Translation elongation factor EFTu/EF1A C-terminal domain-containing protein n=1 Tax=Chryseobacterium salviniae TaxID=3101750 RepID=A0ABU6HYR2_9FLAO|nr:hypothetical protein [Chryseobacterium sp. T9W2-O]MEC3877941.1 hypothetical protein [Chryseobacterium sp. T9W2-O]MEC3877949.1 hypothetical protein [Chryseobacterium sp. T9W2-O]MEC3877963.1 hypothetical protein [Chryseobacterium sp. T9W2-O]
MKIRAKLLLYKGGRETPFQNGYRPLFDFDSTSLVSGRIMLSSEKKMVYPGEETEVEIEFISDDYFGNKLHVGEKILFTESKKPLGEIEIIEI